MENDFASIIFLRTAGEPIMTILIVADSQFGGGRMFQLGSDAGAANQIFGLHESGSILLRRESDCFQNFDPPPPSEHGEELRSNQSGN